MGVGADSSASWVGGENCRPALPLLLTRGPRENSFPQKGDVRHRSTARFPNPCMEGPTPRGPSEATRGES